MATLQATTVNGVPVTTFAIGTAVVFQQTDAPPGWTKSTSNNDKMLRVVSGSVVNGGSVAFSTAFSNQSVTGSIAGATTNGTTLSSSQIPSHSHWCSAYPVDDNNRTGTTGNGQLHGVGSDAGGYSSTDPNYGAGRYIQNTGGGSSHNHSVSLSLSGATLDMRVQYVDCIIATKA